MARTLQGCGAAATMELLVVGIPGPWSPEAMEMFMVLAFYFLLKGRMRFKPASASCYQQRGLLRVLSELSPPEPSKTLIPLLPFMGCSPTHWFPQHAFHHGVKGGLTNCKSDCFHLVQAQRALMQSRMPAQQSCDTKQVKCVVLVIQDATSDVTT